MKTKSEASSSAARERSEAPFEVNELVLVEYYQVWYEARIKKIDAAEDDELLFHVHYVGWSKKRDEWVGLERVKKHTEENYRMAIESQAQVQEASKHVKKRVGVPYSGGKRSSVNSVEIDGSALTGYKKNESGSGHDGSINASAEHQKRQPQQQQRPIQEQTSNKKKPADDVTVINMPERLKRILYEDFFSKSSNVATLCLPTILPSINKVLHAYIGHVHEAGGNYEDARDITAGLKDMFNENLQRQLLIPSERSHLQKYLADNKNKKLDELDMTQLFDAGYLLRLFSKLGPILKKEFTGSDLHTLTKELDKFMIFLSNNADEYFGPVGKDAYHWD